MKRFYQTAAFEDDILKLDGRPVSSPTGQTLSLAFPALGAAIAEEWQAQGEDIRPETMPLTGLTYMALDYVTASREEIIDALCRYVETDLLCYRAEEPKALVQRQAKAWNPVLSWAEKRLGVKFVVAAGIMPVEQSGDTRATVRRYIESLEAFPLTGLFAGTKGTGSIVLGLGMVERHLSGHDAFALSQLDESWQAEQWGQDEEAEARRQHLLADLEAAAMFLALCQGE